MKTAFFLLFLTITLQGFAGVGGSVGGTGTSQRWFQIGKRLETLEDFDGSLQHIVHWPQVVFSNLSTPVKNVCSAGSVLKTISPLKVCTKTAIVEVCLKNGKDTSEECHKIRPWDSLKESSGKRFVYGCVSSIDEQFETSKFYEAKICTKWKVDEDNRNRNVCVEYGNETKEYPDSYDVSVTHSGTETKNQNVEVANLKFEIPECK